MRALLAVTALILLAFPVHAAPAPLVRSVAPGEPGIGDSLVPLNALVGYLDANGNGRVDWTAPNEPIYLDLDGTHTATYGDVRLTSFASYQAGSIVDIANRDLGHTLANPSGWFSSAGTEWFIDFDFSASISEGDLRLRDSAGTKVAATDDDLGTPLAVAQGSVSAGNRVNYVDSNGDRARQAGEPIVLDMDDNSPSGARHFSVGDIVVVATGLAVDADAMANQTVQDGITIIQGGTTTVMPGTTIASAQPDWRSTDWALLGLALLNVVGLIVVARNLSLAQKPRNPFK